jgi:hypothetical protein
MLASLVISLCVAADAPAGKADSLASLYERGKSFAEFLSGAKQRRDTWLRNYGWAKPDAELMARIQGLAGTWRLLVVAEDWCGDSVNTIPYLATFADSAGGRLQIRVVNSTDGKWVMERHRTEDGRAATPTVVVLNAEGEEVGCWVERPAPLAQWMRESRGKMSQDELLNGKYAWYDKDRGQSTVKEILDQIEHAGPGQRCGGNTANP